MGEIEEDGAWILWLGTNPAFRRKGLASALLQVTLSGLLTHGCEQALLNVLTQNTAAINLYQSHGFDIVYRMLYFATKVR
jgi:ribosomal protein S18 acetylase RimI-like enzyme